MVAYGFVAAAMPSGSGAQCLALYALTLPLHLLRGVAETVTGSAVVKVVPPSVVRPASDEAPPQARLSPAAGTLSAGSAISTLHATFALTSVVGPYAGTLIYSHFGAAALGLCAGGLTAAGGLVMIGSAPTDKASLDGNSS